MRLPRLDRLLAVGSLLLVVPYLAACSLGPTAARALDRAPARPSATPLPAIQFPRDEAPHDVLSEWWYYTGHLETADSSRYGFELVIFQAVRQGYPIGYASHFAVTDQSSRSFRFFQRQAASSTLQGGGRFDLSVGDWRVSGQDGVDRLFAEEAGYGLDLELRSAKPPALQRGTGIVSFGPAGDSYYYSRTRMSASGSIAVEGVAKQVTGTAWMDHQWGDFVVGGGGWDWLAFQLDDGSELMVSIVRGEAGATLPTLSYGAFVDPSGRATSLPAEEIALRPTSSWTSPRTGVVYPSGWQVQVDRLGLSLDVQPVIADQELDARQSTGNIYWEGAVSIVGTRGGIPIAGRGYVELTGYREPAR
jgi:predicted secreted hydrolase